MKWSIDAKDIRDRRPPLQLTRERRRFVTAAQNRIVQIGRVVFLASNVTITRSRLVFTRTSHTPGMRMSGPRNLRTHSSQSSPSVAIAIRCHPERSEGSRLSAIDHTDFMA